MRSAVLTGTAALIGSLVLAAPVAAAKDFQKASFKVEVNATQDSSWTVDSTSQGCGGGTTHRFGSGRQTFSLTTKKPVKTTVEYSDPDEGLSFAQFWFGTNTANEAVNALPVNVAALREGTLTVEQLGGTPCADGGDGTPPPPPDCGARSFPGELQVAYDTPLTYPGEVAPLGSVLNLVGPFDAAGDSGRTLFNKLYPNCPRSTTYGDELLLTPKVAFKPKKFFGKDKRFTLKAKDSVVHDGSGVHEEAQMRWAMAFTRRSAPK